MPDINLQIVARGTNVSAQRRENNVVVEIDNTATEAATTQAIAAKDAALAAAATAEQTLARVEQEAGEALNPVTGSVARLADSERDLKYFGWRSNGGQFNDQFVLDAAAEVANGIRIIGRDPEAVYLPSRNIPIAGKADIDLGGAKLLHEIDGQLITATNPLTLVATITAIEDATADFSSGTVLTPTQTTRLTLDNVADCKAGEYGKVLSLDRNAEVRLTDGSRRAEFVRIAAVDTAANTITLQTRLQDTYTVGNGAKFVRLNNNNRLKLRNGRFGKGASTFRNGLLALTNYVAPLVQNMRFEGTQDQALRFVNCLNLNVDNIYGEDLFTGVDAEAGVLSLDATGYLVAVVACEGGVVRNLSAVNARHIFTTSPARINSDPTRYDLYGRSRDILVENIFAQWCQGAALDTHDDGERIKFFNAVLRMAFNGPRNSVTGVGLRGRDCEAHNIRVIGGNGFRLYTDSTDAQAGSRHGGHLLSNCTHIPNPSETYEVYSVRVSGNPVNAVVGNRVEGGDFRGTGLVPGAMPSVSYGTLETQGGKWSAPLASATVTAAALDIREGAVLTMRSPTFDFSAMTAGRLSKWRSRDYNSYAELIATTQPAGTFKSVSSRDLGTHDTAIPNEGAYRSTGSGWERLRSAKSELYIDAPFITVPVGGSNNFASMVDVSGEQATAQVTGASINRICAENGGVSLQTAAPVAGSDVFVDYKVRGRIAAQPATLPDQVQNTTGWTRNVDLGGRGQSIIYVPFAITVGTATNGRMLDMTPPAYDGQIAVIHNRRTSNDTMRIIKSSGTNLNLAADVTLAIGASYRVMGLAGKWVDAL